MNNTDTIYAVSSGAGKAGIAVVRMSGGRAGEILASLAGVLPLPRRAVMRKLRGKGEVIDEALVLWFPGPNSVTGEDVAEFQVHGSAAVIKALFAAFSLFSGVRPAEAGEFSRRAFANGRMDLVEAEGLADLLNAQTERQRQQAVHHMMGAASGVYEDWRGKLLGILAHVEAAVDFSEEEGVAEAALAHVRRDVAGLVGAMSTALGQAERAREVAEGVRVVLAGLPNTGKSSLLNALARREAAIVSSKPGTTRDVIEVVLEIEGMAVVLSDTAGLRLDASDEIELIGIGKTKAELGKADIVFWVAAPDVASSVVPQEGVTPDMLILNKADLPGFDSYPFRIDPRVIQVSARTGQGIERVIATLAGLIIEKYGENHHPVIVRERQKQAIIESIRHLNDSLTHDVNHLELTAEDLRKAANCLARVTGRIDVEDLLSAIFSDFCIGK